MTRAIQQKIDTHWQALRRRLRLGRSTPNEPNRLDLATELVLLIYSFLPVPEQVCLAMSCKTFYGFFKSALKHEDLKVPRLLATYDYKVCFQNPLAPRNRLLLQLENARWAYCAGCLMLHPRSIFCDSTLAIASIDRRCHEFAQVVDVCPCRTLTCNGREQLIKELMELSSRRRSIAGKKAAPPCHKVFIDDRWEPCLTHECSLDRSEATIKIKTIFTISQDNNLILGTDYGVHIKDVAPSSPMLICPHWNIVGWSHPNWQEGACKYCETHAEILFDSGELYFVFRTTRNLGKCRPQPDIDWRKQGRGSYTWNQLRGKSTWF